MTSRDTILQRIRSGMSNAEAAGFAGLPPPPVPEVWPRTSTDQKALADRFALELKAIHGETVRCPTMDEARKQLATLMDEGPWANIAAMDRPLAGDVTSALPPSRVLWAQPDWQPRQMAEMPAGLLTAECLLADTGTCVVACGTAQERLLCYLPPVCVVVARVDQLAEHLPAAWPGLAQRAANRGIRGEFVLVTGPSRTADIEKILILGVHGPKRLVVLLVG